MKLCKYAFNTTAYMKHWPSSSKQHSHSCTNTDICHCRLLRLPNFLVEPGHINGIYNIILTMFICIALFLTKLQSALQKKKKD